MKEPPGQSAPDSGLGGGVSRRPVVVTLTTKLDPKPTPEGLEVAESNPQGRERSLPDGSGLSLWIGEELQHSREWQLHLSSAETAELCRSVLSALDRGLALRDISRDGFPLPRLGTTLAQIREELEHGRGFVLIQDLPIRGLTLPAIETMLWGLGTHLGTGVSQTLNGSFISYVRDLGKNLNKPSVRGHQTNSALAFHSDRTDVIGLLCVRPARRGGSNSLVSTPALHEAIRSRRPDLLEVLYGDFPNHRRGEEQPGEPPWTMLPIFSVQGGTFVCRYLRRFIDDSGQIADAPRLTARQTEALDYLDELMADSRLVLNVDLKAGDLLLMNNHVTLHSRTAFTDSDELERQRLLLRLWLAPPNSRALPSAFRVLYGSIESGAVRGGVPPGMSLVSPAQTKDDALSHQSWDLATGSPVISNNSEVDSSILDLHREGGNRFPVRSLRKEVKAHEG